jgi:hypothetical protein
MWTSASRVPSRALIAFAALACVGAGEPAPFTGMWGAGDALLAVDAQEGRLQVGCTLVHFTPVRPSPDGQFKANGQAEQLSMAPPVGDSEADDALPETPAKAATLTGRAGGGTMDVTLAVEGEPSRTFRLVLGQRGTPARCL